MKHYKAQLSTVVHETLCLECPLACLIELDLDGAGAILECRGAQCKRGLPYAQQEIKSPMRVLTATVLTDGSSKPLLPVRTDRPIPRAKLEEGSAILARLRVIPPIKLGQVLLPDLMGTGASVIATDDLPD